MPDFWVGFISGWTSAMAGAGFVFFMVDAGLVNVTKVLGTKEHIPSLIAEAAWRGGHAVDPLLEVQ